MTCKDIEKSPLLAFPVVKTGSYATSAKPFVVYVVGDDDPGIVDLSLDEKFTVRK